MLSLQMLLQSQLLNIFRTGNPLIDSVLASVLVTAITYLASQPSWLIGLMKRRMKFEKKCVMHVPSIVSQGACSYKNARYKYLTWFLTEKVDLTTTMEITAIKTDLDVDKFIPNDGHTVVYEFYGHGLQFD